MEPRKCVLRKNYRKSRCRVIGNLECTRDFEKILKDKDTCINLLWLTEGTQSDPA